MNAALETIDFQLRDAFPAALSALIESVYLDSRKAKYRTNASICSHHPAIAQIETLIFERFGLRMVVAPELAIISPAAVIPFFRDRQTADTQLQRFMEMFSAEEVNSANRTIRAIVRERQKSLRKIHNRTGFVNTKLAKVGGYLSEVRHYLILDFLFFKNKGITARELSAIVLHEIGHAFDGMEEHYRTSTTNRAILDVLVDLHQNKTDKALYRYHNEFTRQQYERSEISSDKERQDFCGELARQLVGDVQSQLGNKKYDETNFENMADSFSTRFGMGECLTSALVKLGREGMQLFQANGVLLALMHGLDLLALACVFLVFPVYGFVLYTVVVAYLLRISASQMTYDAPLERLGRIRLTLVHAIKDQRLPKELTVDVLSQIDFIDKAMRTNQEYRPFLGRVGDWLFNDARDDRYYIDLQQQIERQLNNRLFVQAAQLRTGV